MSRRRVLTGLNNAILNIIGSDATFKLFCNNSDFDEGYVFHFGKLIHTALFKQNDSYFSSSSGNPFVIVYNSTASGINDSPYLRTLIPALSVYSYPGVPVSSPYYGNNSNKIYRYFGGRDDDTQVEDNQLHWHTSIMMSSYKNYYAYNVGCIIGPKTPALFITDADLTSSLIELIEGIIDRYLSNGGGKLTLWQRIKNFFKKGGSL